MNNKLILPLIVTVFFTVLPASDSLALAVDKIFINDEKAAILPNGLSATIFGRRWSYRVSMDQADYLPRSVWSISLLQRRGGSTGRWGAALALSPDATTNDPDLGDHLDQLILRSELQVGDLHFQLTPWLSIRAVGRLGLVSEILHNNFHRGLVRIPLTVNTKSARWQFSGGIELVALGGQKPELMHPRLTVTYLLLIKNFYPELP